jgi:predicted RNase H-like nuclease (RuvC/YqgF family)
MSFNQQSTVPADTIQKMYAELAKQYKDLEDKHAKEMENMRKHSNYNAIISYNREKENEALTEENRTMSDKIEHLKEEILGLKEENHELTKKNKELTPNVIEMAMKEMDDAMEKRDKRDMENKIHRLTEENRIMSDKIEHLKKRVLEVSSSRDILVGVSQTLRSVIKRQNKELKMWNNYYYNTTHYEPDVPDESEWTHCQTWEEEQ